MSAVAVLTVAALTWFGPAQVSFDAALPGNPYDFHANDVRVTFVAVDGHQEERLAYFDDGHWKAWLATTHPGEYRASLTRNGVPVAGSPVNVSIPDTARIPGGYVRVSGTRFVTDDGAPYFPLGHNLGWQQPDSPTLRQNLHTMGATGMNWTRIWACAFDGKNPFYSRTEHAPPPGELLPAPLRQWDDLIAAAEKSGVRLQLVFFHHGLFSTEVNPNWGEHAWNAKNGGFLQRPQDFFTDATAREYTQRWLRHAVARWGHSPSILAWELFNEVEYVDRVRKDHDWGTVAAWHADMAAFVRGIDPYHHLITTSSAADYSALYDAMDYGQPHIYSRNLTVAIAGGRLLAGKPWFFGEFGANTSGPAEANEAQVARDGIWASILAGHAGAAGYWYWERVAQQHFTHEFTRAARALALSQLATRTDARPLTVAITGAQPAPLVVAPGRGWGANGKYEFALPDEATPENLAQLSTYLRGPDPRKPDVVNRPLVFRFTAPAAGEATITPTGVGAKGAGLQVSLDDRVMASPAWPAIDAQRERPAFTPITVSYTAGPHVLTLKGTGPDWVQFSSIAILELGRTSHAMAIGDGNFAMARVTSEGDICVVLELHFPDLTDGMYELTTLDLDTGTETQRNVAIANGTLHAWPVLRRDVVLVLTR